MPKPRETGEQEQYQLFDTPEYSYRVFVTNRKDPIDLLVWFYSQRGGKPDPGSEQGCGAGRTSFGAMEDELQPFPIDHAGLQP